MELAAVELELPERSDDDDFSDDDDEPDEDSDDEDEEDFSDEDEDFSEEDELSPESLFFDADELLRLSVL